jgi:hypothetical protein
MSYVSIKNYKYQSKIKINKYINRYIREESLIIKGKTNLKNTIISSNEDYSIIRELSSRAYFITFTQLLVMTISKNHRTFYEDFEILYNNSDDYLFYVYETEKYYHMICVSKYKTPESFISWLNSNDADTRYIALAELFDSKGFLIMNRSWNVSKYDNLLIFTKRIGKATVDSKIETLVKHIIKLINHYAHFLPIHFLAF